MSKLNHWQRVIFNAQPIYVNPEKPDWLVPNEQADNYLQFLINNSAGQEAVCRYASSSHKSNAEVILETSRFQSMLTCEPAAQYQGRADYLSLTRLKECWFHLTNNCNLACRHCLFGSSPGQSQAIEPTLLQKGLSEARQLGCNIFYFTGGEPFVYPDFSQTLKELLTDPEIHVVILSNGLLIEKFIDDLKDLPRERLHLQISMDGLKKSHDHLRGKGSFAGLLTNLDILKTNKINVTLSVAVNRNNIDELPAITSLAADLGVKNIHLLWHFVRGKGSRQQFVPPEEILPKLIEAQKIAATKGLLIDNVETMRRQVFSTPGTRHDLSNTGWESIAVGPDGRIYPSPALVAVEELACGNLIDGLEQIWRHSPILAKIRASSLTKSPVANTNPLKFMTGGDDIDHSYLAGGEFVGHDPYSLLYTDLALWLITGQAAGYPDQPHAEIILRMGDVRHDCPDGGQKVSLTHCNCVISLSDEQGHSAVREFYGRAALNTNEDIINPFAPDQAVADYIPADSKKRSYGCGSPVKDAQPKKGEILVDLGSGSGVECFLAAVEIGPEGKVYGIDMTDEMLSLAETSKKEVVTRLGYDNLEFRKGFLEALPLKDNIADVVISNCVINLSPDKRRTFHEIQRILKPGGRLVVSDIVTDQPIPLEIKNNEQFRGECLGGALQQEQLLAMLRAAGFVGATLLKRFPYRQVGNTSFHSLTFRCYKPDSEQKVEAIYRGPFSAVYTEDGTLLLKGKRTKISISAANRLDESVFILDQRGGVTNIVQANNCCSVPTPPTSTFLPLTALPKKEENCCSIQASLPISSASIIPLNLSPQISKAERHQTGCMVCGAALNYLPHEEKTSCHYCGKTKKTNALCANRHFICDDCHQEDGLFTIKLICTETKEQDMISLLNKIRSHPSMPMHGPEHHAIIPGIILATYRNRGGEISRESILAGIERGSKVPGGVCGFWGNCGAATGVGIALSVILNATPLTPKTRQQIQKLTALVLDTIAQTMGSRCCRREAITALQAAADQTEHLLPVKLLAQGDTTCDQHDRNKECIRKQCSFWPAKIKNKNILSTEV
ncbi:MAG: methyltransferase domain-containing protein [Proteobacteria bacterium]|nr:methyltransferase domain-containing protein [Pseudomonadota bacterium]MBU1714903.1 methyltransferase domain-containing protein [Pseudomonadota bacterium]